MGTLCAPAITAAGGEMPGPLAAGPVRAAAALARQVNAAWNALTYVHDPDLHLDIVSLGLVYDVRAEDGVILVEMTLAAPGRPTSAALPQMAQTAVIDALGDSTAVDLRVVWEPPWRPEMIDDLAAGADGGR